MIHLDEILEDELIDTCICEIESLASSYFESKVIFEPDGNLYFQKESKNTLLLDNLFEFFKKSLYKKH